MADSSEGQMEGVSSSSPLMASPVTTPRSGSFMTPSPPPPNLSAVVPSVISSSSSSSNVVLNPSIERLEQENRVLKIEVDTLKLRIKALTEENKSLRRASVSIQAKAEQEEEFISNTLLKRIQTLKKEKETLALNYEQEEECLTNDLSRKLNQLRAEKVNLEHTLEQEQEALVNKLMRKIEKLESETQRKQSNLEQLRHEKIELENTLEQEQEALVNKLWKRMDKLETEKRDLQDKLENLSAASVCSASDLSNHSSSQQMTPAQSPGPAPMSPASAMAAPSTSASLGAGSFGVSANVAGPSTSSNSGQTQCLLKAVVCPTSTHTGVCMCDPAQLSTHVRGLRNEVVKLRNRLAVAEREQSEKMANLERDEREQREQNIKLRKKLQIEIERRERLCRHLSESESSLEIDFDDRHHLGGVGGGAMSEAGSGMLTPSSVTGGSTGGGGQRHRTLSSPVPMNMSPTASKAPPPTPLAMSSPIGVHQMDNEGGGRYTAGAYGNTGANNNSTTHPALARPVSPLSRHKTVSCPRCGYSFLASIGSYTNLFSLGLHGSMTGAGCAGAPSSSSHSSSVSSMGAPPSINFSNLMTAPGTSAAASGGGGGSSSGHLPTHSQRYHSSDGSSSGFHSLPSPLSQPMTPSESMILSGSDQELDKAGLAGPSATSGGGGGGGGSSNINSEETMGTD